MSPESLIIHYGYLLLFFGVIFEGETFLIIGAFLAHRGYLDLRLVVLTAFVGTFTADQIYFWLGRTKGARFLSARPAWQARVTQVSARLTEWQTLLVVGFRFIYGFRTVTPFVIGMSGFSAQRFLLLNLAGGFIWSVVIGLLGYVFGQALELALEDVRRYELRIVLGLITVGTAAGALHLWWRLRTRNRSIAEDPS